MLTSRMQRRPDIQSESASTADDCKLIIAREDQFDFRSAEYRSLYSKSDSTAFQSEIWLDHFYRELLPSTGGKSVILTIRDSADGTLLLVLPLVSIRVLGIVVVESADCQVCDYFAAVHLPHVREILDRDDTIRQSILRCLQPCDLIMLKKMRPEHAWIGKLIGASKPAPMECGSHEVGLSAPFDGWCRTTLSRGFRKKLNRRSRAIEALGKVECRLITGNAELADVLDRLRVYRTGRFGDDILGDEAVFNFYKAIALAGVKSGRAGLYGLFLNDDLVAAEFGLFEADRFIFLLGGADYLRFEKLGPGSQMLTRTLEHLASSGVKTGDFSIGDEPYKSDFGTIRKPLYRMNCGHSIIGVIVSGMFKPMKVLRNQGKRLAYSLN